MMTTYEIRATDMRGELLGTVELDVDAGGWCAAGGGMPGKVGAIERAASLGASLPAVVRRFRLPRSGGGINRETGSPGLSGIFSLRGGRTLRGEIHVSRGRLADQGRPTSAPSR